MYSSNKPSASTTLGFHPLVPEQQPSSQPPVQRPSEMVATHNMNNNMAMNQNTNRLNDWGDANGQVDYFASAGGFNNESMYNTALTQDWSISPIARSRPANNNNVITNNMAVGGSGGQYSYPAQELNPGYEGLQLSSPAASDCSMKDPPPPLPPPLPPISSSMVAASSTAGRFYVDEFTSSMANALADMAAGYPHTHTQESLDTFELSGVDTDALAATGQPTKSEWLGGGSGKMDTNDSHKNGTKAKQSSTNPPTQTPKRGPGRPRKNKAKDSGKGGIRNPTKTDILRGRGGLTNRHTGNIKFRDEARKLRVNYRNVDTSRQEKYLLSQELVKRVKEYGGRFLEKRGTDGLWYETSAKDARKKASQVLREEKWE